MRITIRSKTYDISKEETEGKLRAVEPEEEKRAKYFVEIGGTEFPIKQVLSRTLNLSKATFTTQHAFDILTRLGFKITGTRRWRCPRTTPCPDGLVRRFLLL